MKTICFEETNEENVISFPTDDPLEAFNKIQSECLDTDIIVIKAKNVEILKPINTYIEKLKNSDCVIGGTLNESFDVKFDLLENDTVYNDLVFINYNFCIINCSYFSELEISETDIGDTDFDIYSALSIILSPLIYKSYIFPKLYLDPKELPATVYPEECFAAGFKPLTDVQNIYNSDILLDSKYSESELAEKWCIEPKDLRILELKQSIIKRSVICQEWDIQKTQDTNVSV